MLMRTRATRLCSRCQQDLLRLFVSGFSGDRLVSNRKIGSLASLPRLQRPRPFSTLPSAGLNGQEDKSAHDGRLQHESSIASLAFLNDEQYAAVKELEKTVGRSIEGVSTIDEVKALIAEAVTRLEDENHGGGSDVGEKQDVRQQLPSDEPLIALRRNRSHPEDVARAARQIFGERMPEDVLQEEEVRIYRRLYGDPLKGRNPQEYSHVSAAASEQNPRTELLDADGASIDTDTRNLHVMYAGMEERAQAVADSLGAEYDDVGAFETEIAASRQDRAHPLTMLAKAGTTPSTIHLPKEAYAEPLQALLSDYSNKQLRETSERTFGGPGLPNSPLTARSSRSKTQVAVALHAGQMFMGEMEANAFLTAIMPPAYAAITSVLTETRKRLGRTWLTELLAKEGGPRVLDAGAAGAGILAWNDIVRAHWESLHTSDAAPPPPPPSSTLVLTGSDPLRHRSAALLENTTFIPRLPDYVHVRDKPTIDDDRSAQSRKQYDVIISSYSLLPFKEEWERKQYVQNLWTLLSPRGGILILIEKGMPRGFESIAAARELLLEKCIVIPGGHKTHYSAKQYDENDIHKRTTGMIVAPCTNHEKCPMYRTTGVAKGRKDFCSFQQRYIRPAPLQRVLGAKDRNHDDVDFSYVSVMKGRDLREHHFNNWSHLSDPLSSTSSPSGTQAQSKANTEAWLQKCKAGFADTTPMSIADSSSPDQILPPTHLLPRLVFPPIKRQGHILLDMCTPLGTLERWTVPRSFSKQAFRDSRKAQWGDIWALGAKTRIPRKVRVGTDSEENQMIRARNEKLRQLADEDMDEPEKREKLLNVNKTRTDEESFQNMLIDEDLETEEEDEDKRDDNEVDDDDVVNQVWKDIGIGSIRQESALPSQSVPAPHAHGTSSSTPQVHDTFETESRSYWHPDDLASRQAMAEWEAEFTPKIFSRHANRPAGRATKDSTRKTKRKYRESKRNEPQVPIGRMHY